MGKPFSIHLQSKFLFCVSFLSLIFTLFLLFKPPRPRRSCPVRSPPPVPIQEPLFSYPSSYGDHKYAIPTVHSSCTTFVSFKDYGMVLRQIRDSMTNSSMDEEVKGLKYLSGPRTTFAGNFSTKERKSFFSVNDGAVPCGFMKEFRVSNSDRLAMDNSRGLVVVSAIFGNHDKIRQPRGLGSKTAHTPCFFIFADDQTIKALNVHNIMLNETGERWIGAWRIVEVLGQLPYESPAINGVIAKHLVHRLFPNSHYSIWVDAKLQLTVDPFLLLHSLLISEDADMAISKHPFNVHTMEEAVTTARWKKWADIQSLRDQMEAYCENGLQPWSRKKLPYTTDVPDTALILRKHGIRNNMFSCLLFNELEAFNPRDQLSFAYVRDLMNPKIKINMFEVEVLEQISVEYRHNIKKGDSDV